nr:hypothetical protein L203_06634 [Cryptococcus depauperatus CBS 7841]
MDTKQPPSCLDRPTETAPSQYEPLIQSKLKAFLDAFKTHCSSHPPDTRLSEVNEDISKWQHHREVGDFTKAYYEYLSLLHRIDLDFAKNILCNDTDALESLQEVRTKALTFDYALAIELAQHLAEQRALDASKTGQTGAGSTTNASRLRDEISYLTEAAVEKSKRWARRWRAALPEVSRNNR